MEAVAKIASVIGLDPGPRESAMVNFHPHPTDALFRSLSLLPNDDMIFRLADFSASQNVLAIEMIAHYGSGMPAGAEIFDTCLWIGRFAQAWVQVGGKFALVYRKNIKLHLCGSSRAKDPNVRQALIDRFGPVGTKAEPGNLYGIKSHLWSAAAVAVTYADSLVNEIKQPSGEKVSLERLFA